MKRLGQFAQWLSVTALKDALTCLDYFAVGEGGSAYSVLTAGSLQLRVSNLKSARRSESVSRMPKMLK